MRNIAQNSAKWGEIERELAKRTAMDKKRTEIEEKLLGKAKFGDSATEALLLVGKQVKIPASVFPDSEVPQVHFAAFEPG